MKTTPPPTATTTQSTSKPTSKIKDPLVPHLVRPKSSLPRHLSHVPHDILTKGYAVVPKLLAPSECEDALDKLWDFVEDVSGGMVKRDDPATWYPKGQLVSHDDHDTTNDTNTNNNTNNNINEREEDPWPHTGYSSFPDMFQSLGAGFVLGHVRELMAERLFEPLFGTKELLSSKEGFTFARPTLLTMEHKKNDNDTINNNNNSNEEGKGIHKEYRWNRPKSTLQRKVCGRPQPNSHGEHYDQSTNLMGLHTIQSSITFLDQDEGCDDGHFMCYVRSHSDVHQELTAGTYRGQFSWVPLTEGEIRSLSSDKERGRRGGGGGGEDDEDVEGNDAEIRPRHVYTEAGDVILWRSDLIHAAVPPGSNTRNFRAVGYVGMCPTNYAGATEEKEEEEEDGKTVMDRKMEAYKWGMTGDHRPFVESWHEHKRRSNYSNIKKDGVINWVLERQRPHYRYCPPRVSRRLGQLYGLIPYESDCGEGRDMEKMVERAIIRGVRFLDDDDGNSSSSKDDDDDTGQMTKTTTTEIPLCTARTETLTLEDGKLLPGQDKFLGGMASSCGRYVYGVPGHAKRVLRIDTRTNRMDLIGPSYGGTFKWLRGLDVPADVMGEERYPSGCCLALPSNATSVLKINPETSEVSTFGEIDEKGWLYHGGNLAADGFVYAIPANATRVLKIDPREDTIEYIGPSFPGVQKWYGGILAFDGCIYGIPHNASGILKIDPVTQSCTILGDGLLPEGRWKWHGGLSIHGGKKIIGFPNNADSILVFDVEKQKVYMVGDGSVLKSGRHRIPQDHRYKYLGGATSHDDRYTYLFPCDAERVLRIDNDTFELKLVGPELLEGENKYQNGFVSTDNCLYGIPQRAAGVLRITPSSVLGKESDRGDDSDHVDVLHCGDDMVKWKDKFEGGVIDFDGNIYCIPLRAKALLKVIPGSKG